MKNFKSNQTPNLKNVYYIFTRFLKFFLEVVQSQGLTESKYLDSLKTFRNNIQSNTFPLIWNIYVWKNKNTIKYPHKTIFTQPQISHFNLCYISPILHSHEILKIFAYFPIIITISWSSIFDLYRPTTTPYIWWETKMGIIFWVHSETFSGSPTADLEAKRVTIKFLCISLHICRPSCPHSSPPYHPSTVG